MSKTRKAIFVPEEVQKAIAQKAKLPGANIWTEAAIAPISAPMLIVLAINKRVVVTRSSGFV